MRYQRVFTGLILCLFSVFQIVVAQNSFSVKGVVADSVSGEKLFYANIVVTTADTLEETVSHTTTDLNGSFLLEGIPQGSFWLKASYVGYEIYSKSLTLNANSLKITDLGTIKLTPSAQMLNAVEITAKKPVFAQEGEKTLYNVSEDPTIQGGTTADALQNAPGVEVDIEGNVTLRGASGVEIWINDQPSRLNEESLKQYLQTLPANALERIEVITNPSARYKANGDGGIINIVTNRKIERNSFFGFGLYASSKPDISPWISYAYSKKKWSFNIYSNFGYHNWESKADGYSTMFDDQKDTSNYQTFKTKNRSYNLSGGVWLNGSCKIDSINTLSFWLGSYFGSYYPKISQETYRKEFRLIDTTEYQYNTDETHDALWGNAYGGVWYGHDFNDEGHSISVDVGGSYNFDKMKNQMDRVFSTHNGIDRHTKYHENSDKYSIYGDIDYVLPYIENGEISVGVSGSYEHQNDYYGTDTLFSPDNYQLDSMRFYDANVNYKSGSAYATIQHTFGKFTIKAGIRSNYTQFNALIHNAPNNNLTKGFWGFYPSLHLSYRTKSMHNFKLSYTRRVRHPGDNELTSFVKYGEDNFSKGNPDLLPTYTNSVEAGWTKFFEKFGNVGLNGYFKNSTDEINQMTDVIYDDYYGRMVSFTMPVNSGKSLNTGGEMNVTYRLKDFMQIRFYGSANYSKSETQFREETDPIITESFSYRLRLNYWAKLWKVLEVNASANYRSKSKTLFIENKPTYTIDLGLRADFLKRKISVFVSVSDLFNWNHRSNFTVNPYYDSYNSTKFSSRFIRGGITFRFGKMELESTVRQGGDEGGGGM